MNVSLIRTIEDWTSDILVDVRRCLVAEYRVFYARIKDIQRSIVEVEEHPWEEDEELGEWANEFYHERMNRLSDEFGRLCRRAKHISD